ncbi:calcium/sodium antiporter [bacterium]|nr:calcium/sodium antiporter [bacterium]
MSTTSFLLWLFVFIFSMAVLVKSSDYFTDAAQKIGVFLGVPSFIIGVTIVAMGTSLPELMSSTVAVFEHSSQIVIGNVAGSNITNIFLIMGITAIAGKEFTIAHNISAVDLPMLIGSALVMTVMVADGNFMLFEALLCVAAMVAYMVYTVNTVKGSDPESGRQEDRGQKIARAWLILVLSGALIYIGAKYTVKSIIRLAELLSIGEAVIAASAVALGTSLPELAVSVSAARKGNPEMAVGNVLGSNVFNTFAVMGIPVLLGKVFLPGFRLVITPFMLKTTIPVMVVASLVFYFLASENKINSWKGWMLLACYAVFLGLLFGTSG